MLSAFSLVAGLVFFWVLIVGVRKTDTPQGTIRMGPMVKVAEAAVGIGAVGTIVLGIWLAFSVGNYEIWDGWIIAAIVLWVLLMPLGQRTSAAYELGTRRHWSCSPPDRTGRAPNCSRSTEPRAVSYCSP